MRVNVLLFASYAELAGRERLEVSVPGPATVADVVREVRALVPELDRLPDHPLAALNQAHVRLDAPVAEGDELALLPPFAGG